MTQDPYKPLSVKDYLIRTSLFAKFLTINITWIRASFDRRRMSGVL